jgi:Ca2+-binding EF-hand superfamily protein
LKQVLIALNFNPTDKLLRKVMKQMDTDKNGSGINLIVSIREKKKKNKQISL